MQVDTLITTPCILIHRAATGTRDAHGNVTHTETSVDTLCSIQQQSRSEADDDLADSRWNLYLRRTEQVDQGDAVYVAGVGEFELVGQPWYVTDPDTNSISHIEAAARRTAGPGDGDS